MEMHLHGQSVLVTGASKGIGLAVARAFAREGCSVHLAARSGETLTMNKVAIEREFGVKAYVHVLDLGDASALKTLADACSNVDVLVNNAGEIPSGPLESLDEATWRKSYDVKLMGYMLLARELYPRMKARGSGVIVNDIGNSGENWDANYIAGSTANAALMAFTKALGGVSLDFGVRVVGVNPGPVETDRMVKINRRRAFDLWGDESRWTELRAKYPAGRPASAEEVADLIVFLASPRAGYITGTIVTIDGGIASRGSVIKERSHA